MVLNLGISTNSHSVFHASEGGSVIQHHLSFVNDSFPVLSRGVIRYVAQDAHTRGDRHTHTHTQDAVAATYPTVDDFKREERTNERSETQSHGLSESCCSDGCIASQFPIKQPLPIGHYSPQ